MTFGSIQLKISHRKEKNNNKDANDNNNNFIT